MTNTNGHQALATLVLTLWRGWTLIFALGYYGYQQFVRPVGRLPEVFWLSVLLAVIVALLMALWEPDQPLRSITYCLAWSVGLISRSPITDG